MVVYHNGDDSRSRCTNDGRLQGLHWPVLAWISRCRKLDHIVGKFYGSLHFGWELISSNIQWRLLLFNRQVGRDPCPATTRLTLSKGFPDFYPRPDKDHPLGSPSPSYVWTESTHKPNWVGYLVEKHRANPDLLVYDYAVGGDDVRALEHQIKKRFLPHVGKQPDWARWKSDNTLFGT